MCHEVAVPERPARRAAQTHVLRLVAIGLDEGRQRPGDDGGSEPPDDGPLVTRRRECPGHPEHGDPAGRDREGPCRKPPALREQRGNRSEENESHEKRVEARERRTGAAGV